MGTEGPSRVPEFLSFTLIGFPRKNHILPNLNASKAVLDPSKGVLKAFRIPLLQ
jgi:hypothetical protein